MPMEGRIHSWERMRGDEKVEETARKSTNTMECCLRSKVLLLSKISYGHFLTRNEANEMHDAAMIS